MKPFLTVNCREVCIIFAVISCMLCLCSKSTQGRDTPEILRIKSDGLPEGYAIKIESSFYPEKVNALSKNYITVFEEGGGARPMNLRVLYVLKKNNKEIKIPLVNSKLPILKRWLFCTWRLDNIWVTIDDNKYGDRGLSNAGFLSKNIYTNCDVSWRNYLNPAFPLEASRFLDVPMLPDTIHWGTISSECKNRIKAQEFILKGRHSLLVLSKCK